MIRIPVSPAAVAALDTFYRLRRRKRVIRVYARESKNPSLGMSKFAHFVLLQHAALDETLDQTIVRLAGQTAQTPEPTDRDE